MYVVEPGGAISVILRFKHRPWLVRIVWLAFSYLNVSELLPRIVSRAEEYRIGLTQSIDSTRQGHA